MPQPPRNAARTRPTAKTSDKHPSRVPPPLTGEGSGVGFYHTESTESTEIFQHRKTLKTRTYGNEHPMMRKTRKTSPRFPSLLRGGVRGGVFSVGWGVSHGKHGKWGLAQSLEETTDHRRGRKPPVGLRQQKKPRRGDRVLNMLFANQLDVLSPLRGFCFVDVPEPGVSAPVCGLSHLRCLFTGQQYYFNVSSTKTKRHIIYGNSWGILRLLASGAGGTW